LKQATFKFKVTDWPEDKQKRPIIDMEIHPYLDFKIVSDTKFTFKNKTGSFFGLELVNKENRLDLSTLNSL
jgi:hypothetical protein